MTTGLRIESLLISLLLCILVCSYAYYQGFFKLKQSRPQIPVSFAQVVGAFFAFLSVPLVIVPMLFAIGLWIYHGVPAKASDINLDPILRGWLNLCVIYGTITAMGLYAWKNFAVVRRFFDPDRRGAEWSLRQYGMGLLACLIALPLVFTISQILDWWIEWQFNIPPVEQTAVAHLQSVSESRILFYISLISVATIVPIVEELLFRGFLQTWLMEKMGVYKGIVATAFIFALFHYASQQSWYNLQIVPTLFILALFLGFIYARQRSLWASIALHMLFNFIGISVIFFEA